MIHLQFHELDEAPGAKCFANLRHAIQGTCLLHNFETAISHDCIAFSGLAFEMCNWERELVALPLGVLLKRMG